MYLSDHDLRAEKIREEEKAKLIDQYLQLAIENSAEFGFLNVRGHEVPDPSIVEPPLGYVQQPDLMELMRRMIRNEISQAADMVEFETFEEADDFDIDDDPVDYTSPYEEFFDPPPGAPPGPSIDTPAHRQDPNASPEPAAAASPPAPENNEPATPPKPSK